MSFQTMLADIFNVLLGGLVLGAGLPALFALGIRFASGTGVINEDGSVTHTKDATPVQRALSVVIFGIIIAAVIVGIFWIAKAVVFHHFGVDLFGTEMK
ncbi:hypothetical protein WG915_05260 [Corynebacterium sp. H128]